MKLKNAALAIALLCLSAAPATPFGLGGDGSHFGDEGSIKQVPSGGGGGGCSPTGLIFNVACNSMYATVIHF
jgi:hypothetical protein